MKNPRDERVWTNVEIEQDSAGYLAAQQARHQDEAAASAQAEEDARYRQFEAAFVANGGSKADARAAYTAMRNTEAEQAARFADEAAQRQQRGNVMAAV